ncbi:MAG: nucleotidyltransferase [Bacteroidales bacterium]|nr:nucleotidyltransferase [Bacteroidales bacterium]MCF8386360.1 nucleotidyltransferase [Bacteroidales bacterium]MCF8396798.1 nucleotidyltransferase [Bacteroidales bacterium]
MSNIQFNKDVEAFIHAANKNNLRMLMVGGIAVNYYGYKRHSADIDFWIEPSKENFHRLLKTLQEIGYKLDSLPDTVKQSEQNISLKISPDFEIELITNFNPGKTFDQAYQESVKIEVKKQHLLKWNVLSLEDLITSKAKSGRPKDLLDIQELKKINFEKR